MTDYSNIKRPGSIPTPRSNSARQSSGLSSAAEGDAYPPGVYLGPETAKLFPPKYIHTLMNALHEEKIAPPYLYIFTQNDLGFNALKTSHETLVDLIKRNVSDDYLKHSFITQLGNSKSNNPTDIPLAVSAGEGRAKPGPYCVVSTVSNKSYETIIRDHTGVEPSGKYDPAFTAKGYNKFLLAHEVAHCLTAVADPETRKIMNVLGGESAADRFGIKVAENGGFDGDKGPSRATLQQMRIMENVYYSLMKEVYQIKKSDNPRYPVDQSIELIDPSSHATSMALNKNYKSIRENLDLDSPRGFNMSYKNEMKNMTQAIINGAADKIIKDGRVMVSKEEIVKRAVGQSAFETPESRDVKNITDPLDRNWNSREHFETAIAHYLRGDQIPDRLLNGPAGNIIKAGIFQAGQNAARQKAKEFLLDDPKLLMKTITEHHKSNGYREHYAQYESMKEALDHYTKGVENIHPNALADKKPTSAAAPKPKPI